MAAWVPKSHRHRLEWAFLAICISCMPVFVKPSCQALPTLIACRHSLPQLENLILSGQGSHVIISEYNGELTTNIPEGYGNYTVKSLQVSNSKITGFQPRFFARFSNGKLGHLTLSGVTGNMYLDSETLGGLEDSLDTLYVSDLVLHDVSYLAKLSRLGTLSLLRTGLKELPPNFVRVLRNADKVDLSSNELKTLPWNEVANRIMDITFNELKLTNNPWHCDCSLRSVVEAPLEAKRKIIDLECQTPADVATLPLRALSVQSICPEAPPSREDIGPGGSDIRDDKNKPDNTGTGVGGEGKYPTADTEEKDKSIGGAQGEPVEIATAGGISTEVIAVIIAVVVVVAIVLIAVIVFKVRSRNQRHQKQDGDKQPSHKSSAYCHVIEHPNSKGAGHGRSSGTTNSGTAGAPINNYNKDLEDSERQPLAPPYYSRDPRL